MFVCTDSKPTELLIELVDWDERRVYARYNNFTIGREVEGYVIHSVGKYRGNAGDSFSSHVGVKFSTADRDQDKMKNISCAVHFGGLCGDQLGVIK